MSTYNHIKYRCEYDNCRNCGLTALPPSILLQGPLKCFLKALGKLQNKFYVNGQRMDCPIRTYLVTARDDGSAGKRALNTLRSWGLEIDEALFLEGKSKGPMLEKIRPHIFFDDQITNVKEAAEMGTVACHVPYGKANELARKEWWAKRRLQSSLDITLVTDKELEGTFHFCVHCSMNVFLAIETRMVH